MTEDEFWRLIEQARAAAGEPEDPLEPNDEALVDALTDLLAAREPAEIIEFYRIQARLAKAAFQWPLWNAAYLIEGGCGDDGFMDFRAGLILLGREWFTKAIADPDSLADHPVVAQMSTEEGWIGCEDMNYVASSAYKRRVGETDSFDAAVREDIIALNPEEPSGETWDPEDDEANRQHLPRLAALFPGANSDDDEDQADDE